MAGHERSLQRPRSSQQLAVWTWLVIGVLSALAACSSPNESNGSAGAQPLIASTFTTSTPTITTSPSQSTDGEVAGPMGTTEPGAAIVVDQFGYRPADPKVAVMVDPVDGPTADEDFVAGASVEVRRSSDDSVVFSGAPVAWSNGNTDPQSGDRGWWFDFSSVSDTGTYYVVDVSSNVRSGPFNIDNDVYGEVLDAALKVFWYNRGNVAHPEDVAGPWSDTAAFIGPGQDTEARSVDDQTNPDTALDLHGGWFDAGDTNKYVTFASEPVHQLLTAYQSNPSIFDDAVGIPESGNGIPDVLDEVRWELDWVERMQGDDGGVLTKVGVRDFNEIRPPSQDNRPRYYEEVCSSATISAAAMFAHGALVFADVPELQVGADDLRVRAEAAWAWYQQNPKRADCDPQEVLAGDADMTLAEQDAAEVVAAVYLYALTSNGDYDDVVRNKLESTHPFEGEGFSDYRPHHGDSLLFYMKLANADASTSRAIDERIAELVDQSSALGFDRDADLYRSFMNDWSYHWGSNRVKANIGSGNLALDAVTGGQERALAHLHYFHGVNPLGLVYLSNMESLGAERSVQRLFHYWFGPGSEFDVDMDGSGLEAVVGVAPGYVVGGPNKDFSGTASPPAAQPPQKSYRDWNDATQPVWEITEPAIYYQAAYIRLLALVLGT